MSDKELLSNEEEILRKLICAKDDIPKKTVLVKRIDVAFTLRALKSTEIFQIRERCTYRNERKGIEKFNDEDFFALLVTTATVNPDLKNKKLLEAYSAITSEEVIKKILLPGELLELADIVLNLSGWDSEVTEIKNL
ncbi:MAG: hypothetical protein NZ942_04030 [Candidatus Aenigmarchaeota archaeon]|nr:hypothetical protein [Candidatus Aenigmarchaeota archaeon]